MQKNVNWKLTTAVFVVMVVATPQLQLSALARGADLSISVTEGRDAVLDGDDRREIAVQIFDGNAPAAGAQVVFSLPESGPGGRFSNGASRLSVQADEKGRARSLSIRPNALTGPFNVTVVASLAGARAETAVQQSNQNDAAPQQPPRRNLKKWLLIGLAAAGAVAAAIVLTRDEEPEPTVTIGPPTVGSPQ